MTEKINNDDLKKVSGGKGENAEYIVSKLEAITDDLRNGLLVISEEFSCKIMIKVLEVTKDYILESLYGPAKQSLDIVMDYFDIINSNHPEYKTLMKDNRQKVSDLIKEIDNLYNSINK